MKNKKGITLIALIITIIVMVILAGVAISMIITEEGVITKAEESLNKTEKQEIYEKVMTSITYNEKGNIDLKKTAENIKENFDNLKKIEPQEINEKTEKITVIINGKNGEYTYVLRTKLEPELIEELGEEVVANSKNSVDLIEKTFATQITSENYGDKVNYVSSNGVSDWRIFYNDGTHVFLIISGYLPVDKIDIETKEKLNIQTKGEYTTYWSPTPEMENMDKLSLFKCEKMASMANINTSPIRCVSTLLNTENWTSLKDTKGKAIAVIGSPTVEMWIASWNEKYNKDNIDKELDYGINTSGNGYGYKRKNAEKISPDLYIKNDEGYIEAKKNIDEGKGYGNIYLPQMSGRYWLAAPSSANVQEVCAVTYTGYLQHQTTFASTNNPAFRPVVCLDANIVGKLVGDTWELE